MMSSLFFPFPEMEFLDTSLRKYSSVLLYAIHSPFYWRIFKKAIVYSSLIRVLKILTKKIRETRKLESIHEQHFVERKNEDRKPDKNSKLKTIEKPHLRMPFKNSVSRTHSLSPKMLIILPWSLDPCSTEQGLCSSVLCTTVNRKEGTGVLSLNAGGLASTR